jgi:two-component system, OmpR family, sensor histidine kinase VicK
MEVEYSLDAIAEIAKLSDDGWFVYDRVNKDMLHCNRALCNITGESETYLLNNATQFFQSILCSSESYLTNRLQQFLASGKMNDVEIKLTSRGKVKFISVDAFIVNDNSLVLGIVKDITDMKLHQNYIVEFGARKDALLDMIAHNLSGPLNLTTNLLNAVDVVNKTEAYKKIDRHTRAIRENSQHCIEIINSFLEEEHFESERVNVKNNLFDVLVKTRVVMSRLRPFNEDKTLTIVCAKKELMINGDDVKFFQVIHNLLSNAVKFTPSGGAVIAEIIDLEKSIVVKVSDTGIGIPEHLQPYIFDRYTRASREGLNGEKSIGMGLYIVRKLTELMSGTIGFETEEMKGTTFSLHFPKE